MQEKDLEEHVVVEESIVSSRSEDVAEHRVVD
jgi:hypothetical protein